MNEKFNCPIAVVAYNRPDYLDQCLKSIGDSIDLKEYNFPVYVFCDGGKRSTQKENDDVISKYKFITDVIKQPNNLGIGHHVFFVKNTMFEKYCEDRFIYLEEDVIISPYYYRFVNRAYDWVVNVDSSIVAVNSVILCETPPHLKESRKKLLVDGNTSQCNVLISRFAWNFIKPILEKYLKSFIIVGDYKNRPHDRIVEWAKKQYKECNLDIHPLILKTATSSQDSITIMAMRTNGYRHISSMVNRVLHIGKNGEHCNSDWWIRHKCDGITLDVIESDKDMVEFQLRN